MYDVQTPYLHTRSAHVKEAHDRMAQLQHEVQTQSKVAGENFAKLQQETQLQVCVCVCVCVYVCV